MIVHNCPFSWVMIFPLQFYQFTLTKKSPLFLYSSFVCATVSEQGQMLNLLSNALLLFVVYSFFIYYSSYYYYFFFLYKIPNYYFNLVSRFISKLNEFCGGNRNHSSQAISPNNRDSKEDGENLRRSNIKKGLPISLAQQLI